jgi:hypothetical protein
MNEIFTMLSSLISVLLFWIMIFWFYRGYCVDLYRQKVFRLRAELFDDAMNGKLPFNHKSYGLLRVTMNGSIRFAHKLNLGLLITLLISRRNVDDEELFGKKIENSLKGLTDTQTRMFYEYMTKLRHLTLVHMLQSSPVITATIIIPIILDVVIRVSLTSLIRVLSVPLRYIIAIAYAAGDDPAEVVW